MGLSDFQREKENRTLTMARFYVPQAQVVQGKITVKGEEVRHIRKVLRLRKGDSLSLFDGLGNEYEGKIDEESSFSVSIEVQTISRPERESGLQITLGQSLLKGDKMDYLIRKATELGVRRMVPIHSSRSVPFLDESKQSERRERWEKIVIEAAKQCGRSFLPIMDLPMDYPDFLKKTSEGEHRFILWEGGGERLKDVLKQSDGVREIISLVGPEGGWSREEMKGARKAGFLAVSLGKRILRAETASLSLLSILQYEWGDMG
jgi:16S rRNA (uracil1498-N3)-methyltransferase